MLFRSILLCFWTEGCYRMFRRAWNWLVGWCQGKLEGYSVLRTPTYSDYSGTWTRCKGHRLCLHHMTLKILFRMIGGIERNSKTGLLWNIALDGSGEPRFPGTNSCTRGCRGIVTVNSDGSWVPNQECQWWPCRWTADTELNLQSFSLCSSSNIESYPS